MNNNSDAVPQDKPPVSPKRIEDIGFEQKPMVNWFSPFDLVKIAASVYISKIFSTYADNRKIQAATTKEMPFDYEDNDELWIDYIADTGDGWNSTYTLARILAEPSLDDISCGDAKVDTKRGDLLIIGGDAVYPVACREAYRDRTKGPFIAALPWVESNPPHLFVLPGNHDWYDGLASFTRLFCQQRWLGGWKTRQSRSYFSLLLPHRWWVFAVDIQLGSDIDKDQLDYFDQVLSHVKAGDKVIFLTAIPVWVMDTLTGDHNHKNITFLEKRISAAGAEVYVNVAGDLHHYARYKNNNRENHKITAGGGGAFLHGTNVLPKKLSVEEAAGNSECTLVSDSIFPSEKISNSLVKGNLNFVLNNKRMSLLFGFWYLFSCWVLHSASITVGNNLFAELSSLELSLTNFKVVFSSVVAVFAYSPLSVLIFLLLLVGSIAFCEPHPEPNKKRLIVKKLLAGGIHGICHSVFIILVVWALLRFNSSVLSLQVEPFWQASILSIETLLVGGIVGGTLMGFYLYTTYVLFKFHCEAAFSSNRIEDYKNFLRFHIKKNGQLTIYPMGIKSVEKRWQFKPNAEAGKPWFVSSSNKPINEYVHLIEEPIKINGK